MSANGSNNFLNIEDANLRVRSGSVHAQGMTIGGITVGTAHGLQSVTDTSNTTSNTLQFTNATTAFKATSNIELTSASKIIVDSNVVTEYTGLATTLKSVYDVPATTGTQLEVYYDAKDLADGAVTSVTDLSPNSNDGSPTDVSVSDGAFVFNGTSSLLESSTTIVNPTGDTIHAFSLWVKPSEDDLNGVNAAGNHYLIIYGTELDTGKWSGISISNKRFASIIHASVVRFGPEVRVGEWYHITLNYKGGGIHNSERFDFFINGLQIGTTALSTGGSQAGSATLNLSSPAKVVLGGLFTGAERSSSTIANARLYSKTLNAGQIQELYDYQKDYFFGSKSQLTLYKGHLGVGVTEPSGQLELAGDERIQEYPPMAMTGWETYMEGHGVFRAGKSGHDGYLGSWDRWKVFNKGFTANGGTTGDAYHGEQSYSSSTGSYTGSESLGGISGDYFILDMPYKISLKRTNLTSANLNRSPTEFIILGSNDGSTWTQIKSFSSSFTGQGQTLPFQVNSTEYFSYFGLVVTKIVASDGYFMLSEWQLFGTPGPTTLDKGSLTLGRSLDVPRVSRYDVDTETPRPEKLVLDFDTTVNSSPTDISGKGNHARFLNSAEYSAPDKAFYTPAAGIIYAYPVYGLPTGNTLFTMACWMKLDSTSTQHNQILIAYGSNWGCAQINSLFVRRGGVSGQVGTGYQLAHSIGCTAVHQTTGTFEFDRWYFCVSQKVTTGATDTVDDIRLWIDGREIPSSEKTFHDQARNQSIGSSMALTLGGAWNNLTTPADQFQGWISNPKIYDAILEPSEIKKLYRLGRTGRSMVISDTAVGIGKAPEAQLDVRGTISFVEDSFEIYKETSASWSASSGFENLVYNPYNEGQSIWRINGDQSTTADRYLYTVPRNGILTVNVTMIHKVGTFKSGAVHHANYWCLRKSTDNGSTWETSLTAELVGHRWVNTTNWHVEWRPVCMSYTGRVNAGDQVALFFQTDYSGTTGAVTTEGCRMNGILI